MSVIQFPIKQVREWREMDSAIRGAISCAGGSPACAAYVVSRMRPVFDRAFLELSVQIPPDAQEAFGAISAMHHAAESALTMDLILAYLEIYRLIHGGAR